MRQKIKWGVMIGAWASMILSLSIDSAWAKEMWSSIAVIGFIATLGFYLDDK